jgi:DNA-3-methyladenine glycosylase I
MADSEKTYLRTGDDGIIRCWWGSGDADYQRYHDEEWGQPVNSDFRLFEKICLEGFQSGLSWLTILRKRENFRAAFAGFDFNIVAAYGDADVKRLLQDAGIVRHRGKIEATINNAGRAAELVNEYGSVAAYIWEWEPKTREPHVGKGEYAFPIPSVTETSKALSKDLKKRGWRFFGPTTAYAFMQAMGMVNDHIPGCPVGDEVERLRREFDRPVRE